jgi:AcrR family transcriptional regulator
MLVIWPVGAPRACRVGAPPRHILDAAITVFAHSVSTTTTAAIAAQLGVSEPTIFRHFVTKRALYLEALSRSSEITMARWREIAAARRAPDGAARDGALVLRRAAARFRAPALALPFVQ